MTSRGTIRHPSLLGKSGHVQGAISAVCMSHCPSFKGLFIAMAKRLCRALNAELHRSHGPTEGTDIPLEGAVSSFHHTKGMGRPSRHWTEGSHKDMVTCGGQHTNEEKSHISVLMLASRGAPPATAHPPDPHREEKVRGHRAHSHFLVSAMICSWS